MKRPVIIAVLCLIASLLVMFFGFHDAKVSAPAHAHTLALLTQEDTGSFLLQLRYGAEAAAAEAGNKLSIVTLNKENPAAQIAELHSEGVAALLLYGSNIALVRQVQQICADANIPLVLLDRGDATGACVASDETLAGQLAAEQAHALKAPKVLLLTDKSPTATRRMHAAVAALSRSVSGILSWDGWVTSATLPDTVRKQVGEGACVIALTREAMLAAVRLRESKQLGANCPIVGIDTGPDNVPLLEQGYVSALVLPAPYTMGYRGCGLAIAMLGGADAQSVLVEPRLITATNLYSAANVSVAFPLLQ